MSTYSQAKSLFDDLVGAHGAVSWQIGKVGNVLLEQAKQEQSDNAALAALDPFEPAANRYYIANVQADGVRAIVGQIVAATEPHQSIV